MKTLFAFIMICLLLPCAGYGLSDREAFELLMNTSIQAKPPIHVYVAPDYNKDNRPDYGAVQGTSLPVSSYQFFGTAYEELKTFDQPGEIYAVSHFSLGSRWLCFLLRVPGMYAPEAIDIWVFDTEKNKWLKPLRIAEWWGDAGYEIDTQAWIRDVNKDGLYDIVRRTIETDTDLEDPKSPQTKKRHDDVLLWDKGRWRKASPESLTKIGGSKYKFYDRYKK